MFWRARVDHFRLTVIYSATRLIPTLALIGLFMYPEAIIRAASGISANAGGFVVWQDIPNPCAPNVNTAPLDMSCHVVGSSTIVESRTFHVAPEAKTGGVSRYRIMTMLISAEGVYKSGIEATTTYSGQYGLKTELVRFCESPTGRKAARWGPMPGAVSMSDPKWSLGIVGLIQHDSACAIQGNCTSTTRRWNCRTVLSPGASLKPLVGGNHLNLSGVPMTIDAILTFHGIEVIDNDLQTPNSNPRIGALTGIDIHMRDNLYYAFSESQPLEHCVPGGCGGDGDRRGWAAEGNRVRPWPFASPSNPGAPGRPKLSSFSGGSSPTWDICYKYAVGTACFCDQLGIDSVAMYRGYDTGTIQGTSYGDLWDHPDDWSLLGAAQKGLVTPNDEVGRQQYTVDNGHNGTSDGMSIRYNCHGLTFKNATQSNPYWLQHAEPELPPCTGGLTRIYEDTPPGPGDIAVWYDINNLTRPRWSIHSATVNGTWSGGTTPMKTKNGMTPRWDYMTLAELNEIYFESSYSTEIVYYRP